MLNKVFIIILICLFQFQVQANEVYVIKNIKIAADNKVASIARNEAIEGGKLKAFRGLVKLHYPGALNKINTIDKDDIYSLVESYELSDERRSATHYSAKLQVRFSKQHVDQLMNSIGVYYTKDTLSPTAHLQTEQIENQAINNEQTQNKQSTLSPTLTTLVIPVYINQNSQYWFDENNNQWLKVWLSKELSNKFIVPIADLEDLLLLNSKIFSKNLIDLTPLLDKYNANNIAVYTLEDLTEENNQNHIVSLKVNYLNRFHYSWQTHNFVTRQGTDLTNLLEQAYEQAQVYNFSDNKEIQEDQYNEVDTYLIEVEYTIKKLSDWTYLQKILTGISYIDTVKLNKINRKVYDFSFTSKVSIDDLVKIFKHRGFLLEERNNKFYLSKDLLNEEN